MNTLKEVEELYMDTPEVHTAIWNAFTDAVNANPILRGHRNHIEVNGLGYGDRPFHRMWELILADLGQNLNTLEIGVFKGQTLSLFKLLEPTAKVTGITPLSSDGDKYATHPNAEYMSLIKGLHDHFALPYPRIIDGYSFDPRVQFLAREKGPYDLLFVDGGHDYEVVADDLKEYAPMIRVGGYLVVDDAANDLNIPDGLIPQNFKGLPDVTKALGEFVAANTNALKLVCSVGHNKVFRKLA